jgi:hypothetical protein
MGREGALVLALLFERLRELLGGEIAAALEEVSES